MLLSQCLSGLGVSILPHCSLPSLYQSGYLISASLYLLGALFLETPRCMMIALL
jgi:hypothetical protein